MNLHVFWTRGLCENEVYSPKKTEELMNQLDFSIAWYSMTYKTPIDREDVWTWVRHKKKQESTLQSVNKHRHGNPSYPYDES